MSPKKRHQSNVTRFFHFGLLPIKISDYASANQNQINIHYTRFIPLRVSRVSGTRLRGFAPKHINIKVVAMASRWQHVRDLIRPGFEPHNSRTGESSLAFRTSKNLRYAIHSRIFIFHAPFVRISNKKSSGENKNIREIFRTKRPFWSNAVQNLSWLNYFCSSITT